MKHALGPLHIEGPSTGNGPYDDGGDYCIYHLNGDGEKEVIGEAFRLIAQDTEAPAKDNAQLFAAAPDLLEACEGLVNYRDSVGALNFQLEKADDFIRLMRLAITKARGKNEETT